MQRASTDDIKGWNDIFISDYLSVQGWSLPFGPEYVIVLHQDLNSVFTVFLANIQVNVALSRYLFFNNIDIYLAFLLTFLAPLQTTA